jgi:hypothetical protein
MYPIQTPGRYAPKKDSQEVNLRTFGMSSPDPTWSQASRNPNITRTGISGGRIYGYSPVLVGYDLRFLENAYRVGGSRSKGSPVL